jgi:hypothetical protein
MKRLHIAGNLSKSLLLAGLLTACNSEQMVSPNETANITADDKNAKVAAFIPRLLKDGSRELEYYDAYNANRDKLWKVKDSPAGEYTEYLYNGQTITAQRKKISTNNLVYQVTYQLDANGRCVESSSTETNKTLKYEYGQLGRLMKVYEKNNPNERMELGYLPGVATQLKTIYFFDKLNTKTREITFNYNIQGGGGSPMENKYPTNPVALDKTAEYLNIFGLFHTNLVTFEFDQYLQMNGTPMYSKQFSYIFNASGYAKTILADVGNVVETKSRTYTVPKI